VPTASIAGGSLGLTDLDSRAGIELVSWLVGAAPSISAGAAAVAEACNSPTSATWSRRKGNEGIRLTALPRRIGIDSHGNDWTFLSRTRKRCSSFVDWVSVRDPSSSAKALLTSMPI
jgi:hypothetical protein